MEKSMITSFLSTCEVDQLRLAISRIKKMDEFDFLPFIERWTDLLLDLLQVVVFVFNLLDSPTLLFEL